MATPRMQSVRMEGDYAVGSDTTSVTIVRKLCREREPSQHALHSKRIRGASHLVVKGASELQIQAGR